MLHARMSAPGTVSTSARDLDPCAQASTLLSDGRVFTNGGSWNGGIGIKNGEIWSEAEGWKWIPGCVVCLQPVA